MLGARNERLQRVRRLVSSRRSRVSEGLFVIEGPTLLADAVDAGVELVEVFHEPGADPRILDTVAEVRVACHPVRSGVLASVGDAVASQGVLAVAHPTSHQLDDVPGGTPVLVLVEIGDPGNAGTLLRSAEAAGFGAVLFGAGSVDPWSPKVVRASAGSVFRVRVISGGEAGGVLEQLRATGRRCVGTRTLEAPAYTDAELPADVAIVLGSEAHGLPAEIDEHVDDWVRIPMAGSVESLNVAMAGTLLCFEVARRSRG